MIGAIFLLQITFFLINLFAISQLNESKKGRPHGIKQRKNTGKF